MTTETIEIEDLLAVLRAGRKPRDHGPYKIQVGDQDLNFTGVVIDDPMPTGRQIIETAGNRKAEEHLVFQVLRNGELEELNLEETADLRAAKIERFLIFCSSASYRFDIDGNRTLTPNCRLRWQIVSPQSQMKRWSFVSSSNRSPNERF